MFPPRISVTLYGCAWLNVGMQMRPFYFFAPSLCCCDNVHSCSGHAGVIKQVIAARSIGHRQRCGAKGARITCLYDRKQHRDVFKCVDICVMYGIITM
jgi:hypothetical protein